MNKYSNICVRFTILEVLVTLNLRVKLCNYIICCVNCIVKLLKLKKKKFFPCVTYNK